MQSSTYRDIIESKLAEWQGNLKKLEEQAAKATSDTKAIINPKVELLKSAIETARVQLYVLDKEESIENTMETKEKILKIFSAVDKDFPGYVDRTPFML